MKHRILILLLLLTVLLCGCNRIRFTEEQELAQEKKAQPLLEAYLDSRFTSYELDRVDMVCGPEPGNPPYGPVYASGLVTGRYLPGGTDHHYRIGVNTETGVLYSNENAGLLSMALSSELTEVLSAGGIGPVTVTDQEMELKLLFTDVPAIHNNYRNVTTEATAEDLIPVTVTEETARDFVSGGFGEGCICRGFTLFYHCDEKNAFPVAALEEYIRKNGGLKQGDILVYNCSEEALASGSGRVESAREFWRLRMSDDGQDLEVFSYTDHEALASVRASESAALESSRKAAAEIPPEAPGKDCSLSIKYKKQPALMRCPHFTEKDGTVTMQFNGTDWYSVRIVSKAWADWFAGEHRLLAEGGNMKAYAAPENEQFPYVYLMDPGDSYPDCFCFSSSDSPDQSSYGSDFGNQIQYFADKTEIIPEKP